MQQKQRNYNLKPTVNKDVKTDYSKERRSNKHYSAKVERIEVPAVPIEVVQTIAAPYEVVRKKKKSKLRMFWNKCTGAVQNGIVYLIKVVFLTGLVVRRVCSLGLEKLQGVGVFFKKVGHYFKWKTSKAENKDELFSGGVPPIDPERLKEGQLVVRTPSLVEKFIAFDKKLLTGLIVFTTGVPKNDVTYPIDERCRHKIFRAFSTRALKVYIPAACVVLVGSVLYSAKDYTIGVKAIVDDQQVAVLKNEEEYDAVFKRIGNYVSSISGQPYNVEVTPVFKMAIVNKKEVGTYGDLEDLLLLKADDIIHETNGLYVDGVLVASNPDKVALVEALDEILERNKNENQKVEFIQDIRVENVILPRDKEKSIEEIKTLLTSTVEEEAKYTVAKADVLGTIAKKFDMTVSELKVLNPAVSETKLRAGEDLVVAKQKQYLAVKTMETMVYNEVIAYKTEVNQDSTLYNYTTQVKQKGKNGEAQVVAEIISIDGMELSKNIVSRNVISEPVVQIEHKGTKTPPPKSPTGKYLSPVSGGVVSSRYGVKRGKSYHTGLDIALSTGSTIVAADGGTVVFSGWSGGYGYVVRVSHENGQETVYAHCSKLLVSKGQKVGKGEPIAKVGSTGNSSGPHIHFEIRINGKTVNPAPYIGR